MSDLHICTCGDCAIGPFVDRCRHEQELEDLKQGRHPTHVVVPRSGPPSGRRPRLRECVEAWPDCSEGDYDPKCCRFPKSCSCTVYGDDTPAELLESRDGAPTCKHGTHKDSQCDDCFAEKGDDNNPFASQGSESS